MKTSTFNSAFYYKYQTEREFYVEDVNMKVQFYNGTLEVTDLTNAQKVGKACESYSVKWMEYDNSRGVDIVRMFNFNLRTLFNFLKAMPFNTNRWGGYEGVKFQMFE